MHLKILRECEHDAAHLVQHNSTGVFPIHTQQQQWKIYGYCGVTFIPKVSVIGRHENLKKQKRNKTGSMTPTYEL